MANNEEKYEIEVNNKPVHIAGPRVTGLQIKQAAIAQGVEIQLEFALKVQTKDGGWESVGDSEKITLNKHTHIFRAIEGDENS